MTLRLTKGHCLLPKNSHWTLESSIVGEVAIRQKCSGKVYAMLVQDQINGHIEQLKTFNKV